MIPVTDVLRVHLKPAAIAASHGALVQAKPRWIDFDAGPLLTGATLDDLAQALFDLVIVTASGRPTCAERNGEREVAIWRTGVTL
jgi:altronate hydrolase